jgi:hypothetical protein
VSNYLEPNPPINEQELSAFEARYKLVLPNSYKKFLLKNNGGQPLPAAFPVKGFHSNPVGVIQAFFGLNATIPTEDFETVLGELRDLLPVGIFPIACTEGYDLVCIDLRLPGSRIVFWDRKPSWGTSVWSDEDLYFVADDFESFLVALHEFRLP